MMKFLHAVVACLMLGLLLSVGLVSTSTTTANSQVIRAFIVPHSHCDPGWIVPVDTYYALNVSVILSNTIPAVAADPKKRFIWAETVYWKMWWEQQNADVRNVVTSLIAKKQLEFVNGGYVMHDEALPDYNVRIDQMTAGHQYLMETVGVKPRVGWSIDPFGASRINPVLNRLMGFNYTVINRVDDRYKYKFENISGSGEFIRDQLFQFYWQGSENYKARNSIFTHILDHHYSSPTICSNNTCTGFDFEGDPEVNPPIDEDNIDERARILVQYLNETRQSFRTRNLLIPFGNDFRFQNPGIEFENMDKLIEYINNTPGFGVQMQYSTLSEYFDAVMEESTTDTFPVKTWDQGDFFPYTNCYASDVVATGNCIAYWSGFFTSHPEFKGLVRRAEQVLRTGEIIHSLGFAEKQQLKYLEDYMVTSANQDLHISWPDLYNDLQQLREAVSLAQHHDSITGTETTITLNDYISRLMTAIPPVYDLIRQLISYFMVKTYVKPNLTYNADYAFTHCAFSDGQELPIVMYNSLAWERTEYLAVKVNVTDLQVISNDGSVVPSDIIVNQDGIMLYFLATIPPLGLRTYFIRQSPEEYEDNDSVPTNTTVTLENGFLIVTFRLHDGQQLPYVLQSIQNKVTEEYIEIEQELMEYTSWKDGAYIFRPEGAAEPLQPEPEYLSAMLHKGENVQQLTQTLTNNVTTIFRVYNGYNDPEVGIFVEFEVTAQTGDNKELISRFNLKKNGKPLTTTLYTDSDGFEMTERKYAVRFNDTSVPNLIAGNYYPMVRSSYIREKGPHGSQFSLIVQQPMGVASLTSGSMEFMINRNSLTDDQRGLGQNLNVTIPIHIKTRFMFATSARSEDLRPRLAMMFDNPMVKLFVVKYANMSDDSSISEVPSQKDWESVYLPYQSALSTELPDPIMLLTLQTRNNATAYFESQAIVPEVVVRFHHIYGNSDVLYSNVRSLFINHLFSRYTISNVVETTLSLMYIIDRKAPEVITVNPGEIRTFILNMQRDNQMNDNVFAWFQLESFIFGVGASSFLFFVLTILVYIVKQVTKSHQRNGRYEEL